MKKNIIVLLTVIGLFLIFPLSTPAFTNGYVAFGGGGGGDAKAANMRFELGGFTINKSTNFLLGIGIPFTLGRDETPSDMLEYPVPHWDFTYLGKRYKGEEVGLYGKFGIEVGKRSGLFALVYAGGTWGKEIELAQSNVTRWHYQESETTKTYGLIGGGIGYFPRHLNLCLQLGFDNRLGFNALIGFYW